MATSYTLRDLINAGSAAERLPVTERAVRQYLAEGLLPPATGQGLAATYGDEHVARLRMVLRLAGQYVPLAEIQRWIVTLHFGQIQALLDRPAIPRLPIEGDAQAYLLRLQKSIPSRSAVPGPVLPAVVVKRSGLQPALRPANRRAVDPAVKPEVARWIHATVSPDTVLVLKDGAFDAQATASLIEALVRALAAVSQTGSAKSDQD